MATQTSLQVTLKSFELAGNRPLFIIETVENYAFVLTHEDLIADLVDINTKTVCLSNETQARVNKAHNDVVNEKAPLDRDVVTSVYITISLAKELSIDVTNPKRPKIIGIIESDKGKQYREGANEMDEFIKQTKQNDKTTGKSFIDVCKERRLL